jgi:hypothetical protein
VVWLVKSQARSPGRKQLLGYRVSFALLAVPVKVVVVSARAIEVQAKLEQVWPHLGSGHVLESEHVAAASRRQTWHSVDHIQYRFISGVYYLKPFSGPKESQALHLEISRPAP